MIYTYPSICPLYQPRINSTGMCEESDHQCDKDIGGDCDYYDEWKHELQEDVDG